MDFSKSHGLSLKQQVMLNQYVSITGCPYEDAVQLLVSANWQYERALGAFFGDLSSILPNECCNSHLCLCVPKNTPATPPNLDYLENAFSKLASASNNNNNSQSFNGLMDVEPQLTNEQQAPQANHSQHKPIEINNRHNNNNYCFTNTTPTSANNFNSNFY